MPCLRSGLASLQWNPELCRQREGVSWLQNGPATHLVACCNETIHRLIDAALRAANLQPKHALEIGKKGSRL